ncbi:MAG TPA: hypothetical protein VFS44_00640 [Gemmatimonadaceae bacterium]|nr:hypothetical protein [Gemmatimonadaceae bacterium]
MTHRLAFAFLLLALAAGTARAQGTLSTQGFGYPPGESSTRSASMGGALSETDALSPFNPAALANWGRSGVYLQYSPEYRRVSGESGQDKTMTARFPLAEGALTVGRRGVVGISAAGYLDRTWETSRTGYDHFGSGADSTQFTESFQSSGAINDIRLAGAYAISRSLWIGAGAHVFTGDNRLAVTRTFPDTTFSSFSEQSTISYTGTGVSAGIVWQPVSAFTIGVSGRSGGTIKSFRNDTTLSRARVPKRAGVGIAFTGIPGFALAASAEWQGWSSLAPLGNEGLGVTDAWDVGVGAEVRGPAVFGTQLPLRIGYRRRTLPFTVESTNVRENTFSFGAGLPIARGASRIDVGVERANRGSAAGVSEHAWILSFGFMVRP